MSSNKLPSLVTPDEWKQRTSLTLVPRTDDLKRVDSAYANWYSHSQSHRHQSDLLAALDAYLLANGNYWDKVKRNRESNGLMEYIHSLMRDALGVGVKNPLQALDIPHSRYGVLFLLGNTQVKLDKADMILGGIEKLGKVAAAPFADQLQAINVTGKFNARQVTAFGLNIAGKVAQPILSSSAAKRPDYRNVIGPPIQGKIADLIDNIHLKLLGRDGLGIWRIGGVAVRQLSMMAAEYIVGHAVPFLRSGMELGEGVVKTMGYVYENAVVLRLRMRDFNIEPGHPASIANAIQMNLLSDLGSSSVRAGVAAGKMFLESVTAGAAVIATAVVTALEWLVDRIIRFFEMHRIRTFLEEAAGKLREERQRGVMRVIESKVEGKVKSRVEFTPDVKGGLIADTKAFTEFFERGCKASVIIPMLTLNSGICGNAMTYTRMFRSDSGDSVIDQQTFDNSVAFFGRLKALSSSYLRQRGFTFSSSRPDVNGLLMHAVRDHHIPHNDVEKALAFL